MTQTQKLVAVKTALETIRIGNNPVPVAYYQFPESAQDHGLPFIVYYVAETQSFAADNVAYHTIKNIVVELYTQTKDPTTEALVEAALADFYWESTEQYIPEDEMWEVLYSIQI